MKKVLITGGSGGIALAVRDLLLDVFEVYSPCRSELDVTDRYAIDSFFKKNGPFDVVINNAGSIHPATVQNSDRDKWINDINVNLVAPYLVSKSALEMNTDTVIINIASSAGYSAYKEWSSYCASKAGVITLTKSMANEGVAAFALSPGAIDTKFRDYFDLPNVNLMSPDEIALIVRDIINGKYEAGCSIFVRKGALEIR